jgi:pimeloyl-ACP methyl ester carboxylesterase
MVCDANIEVAGGRIAFARRNEGAASTVLLLHGGGPGASGANNFERNIPALAGEHDVIVLDLPGYGRSDPLAVRADGGILDAYARAVAVFLNGLGVERCSLIGNSLGGGVALMFARLFPEVAHRVVAFGPAGGFSPLFEYPTYGFKAALDYYGGEGPTLAKMRRFFELMVYDASLIPDDLVRQRFEDSRAPEWLARNPPLLQDRSRSRMEQLWREDLSGVTAPVLLVFGQYDRVTPIDTAFAWMKVLPDCEVHILPRCGHWAQWERAADFNRVTLEFLRGDR